MSADHTEKNKSLYKKFSSFTFFNTIFPSILLLFFAFSFLYRSDLAFGQDLGMHLKLGEIIWQTQIVPKINLVSYTNPTFPFINHHWLFEVLVYLGSISIGLQSLLVIKIFLLLLSAAVILLISKKTQ